jgi:hypothetical protein
MIKREYKKTAVEHCIRVHSLDSNMINAIYEKSSEAIHKLATRDFDAKIVALMSLTAVSKEML